MGKLRFNNQRAKYKPRVQYGCYEGEIFSLRGTLIMGYGAESKRKSDGKLSNKAVIGERVS